MKIEGKKKLCCWCNKPAEQKMTQQFKDGSTHTDHGCQEHFNKYKNTYEIK
jgi:hypothetical protein